MAWTPERIRVPCIRGGSRGRWGVDGETGSWSSHWNGWMLACQACDPEDDFPITAPDMNLVFRTVLPAEIPTLRRLTVESFGGVNIEEGVERALGVLNGHDWQWRKARHIDADFQSNPEGIFVAEDKGTLVGYVTTTLDRAAGKGRIPNLVVAASKRGQGLGRQLIEHALEYFRKEGMSYAVIETLEQNEVGRHLYPACGFVEVARQIHYARAL